MSYTWKAVAMAAALCACSGEDDEPARDAEAAGAGGSASETSDSLPLMGDDVTAVPPGSDAASPASGSFTSFADPSTGFSTEEVHDADREVVHFDPSLGAMIWAATGDAVSGWTTSAADLSWSRSGVAFQVRFGTEQGERRAYFTERATGTICNLNITAPEQLSIFGTNEPPPEE
jgi:hypothetical protein